MVNAVEGHRDVASTFEEQISKQAQALKDWKSTIDRIGLNPSDRKKMLALPFYLAKRAEKPKPSPGQKEWDLFEKIYGSKWNAMDHIDRDPEKKITEFDYEDFIPAEILKNYDTSSPEFRKMIRKMNLNTRTKYEQHKDDQEAFSNLMPLLAGLTGNEMDALVHKLKNESTNSEELLDRECNTEEEERMAKLSEEENFNLKNYYRHTTRTLKWADKKRMKVDENKVRDMLRNQHIVR